MRTSISLVVALALTVTSLATLAETASAEPAKTETHAASANPDNSADAAKPTNQTNAAEPVISGLEQPLCVQK